MEVKDLLPASRPDLPAPQEKPGIITLVQTQDPDGNKVTLWQDLMPARHR